MEIRAIITNIAFVSNVLDHFGLHKCQKSEEYALLKDTAEQMKSIGSMTLTQIEGSLKDVKQKLFPHLRGNIDLGCLKLFEVLQRNVPFYHFAKRMGFTGPNGRDTFLSRYRMVEAVQHEEYNQAVLRELHASYKYISPFFNKEIEFVQLIEEIVQLQDINKGINYLEEVAANIAMIKVLFDNVEVKSIKHACTCPIACSTCKKLSCIIQ